MIKKATNQYSEDCLTEGMLKIYQSIVNFEHISTDTKERYIQLTRKSSDFNRYNQLSQKHLVGYLLNLVHLEEDKPDKKKFDLWLEEKGKGLSSNWNTIKRVGEIDDTDNNIIRRSKPTTFTPVLEAISEYLNETKDFNQFTAKILAHIMTENYMVPALVDYEDSIRRCLDKYGYKDVRAKFDKDEGGIINKTASSKLYTRTISGIQDTILEPNRQIIAPLGRDDGSAKLLLNSVDLDKCYLNITPTLEYFDSFKGLAIDDNNIDHNDFLVRSYRTSGVQKLMEMLVDPDKQRVLTNEMLLVNPDRHLFSVGGPKSSPSTLISLGYDHTEHLDNDYSFYYSYELNLTKKIVIENYGDKVQFVENFFIKTKKANEKTFKPSLKLLDNETSKFKLKTDIALLTMCPNPFNPHFKHFIFSSCQGIGCKTLPYLVGDINFQKDISIPDNFTKNSHFQAVIEIPVEWKESGYYWNQEEGYKILDIQGESSACPIIRRSPTENLQILKKIIESRPAYLNKK